MNPPPEKQKQTANFQAAMHTAQSRMLSAKSARLQNRESTPAAPPEPPSREAALNKVLQQIGQLNRQMKRLGTSSEKHLAPPLPTEHAALPANRFMPQISAPISPAGTAGSIGASAKPQSSPFVRKAATSETAGPASAPAVAQILPRAWQSTPNRADHSSVKHCERQSGEQRLETTLESFGLLPEYAAKLAQQIHAQGGPASLASLDEQFALARQGLIDAWRTADHAAADSTSPVHVFIGAPGAGKTTCLDKWLARAVLLEGHSAHVWRLDGRLANTAEALSVYAEILGVPVHRAWPQSTLPEAELHLVDLPGVDWREAGAVQELAERLQLFRAARIHLVLNAAYEPRLWLEQVAVFGGLPVQDLIVTHLDEELRWGKLWNLVLGTNYALSFLSAGQNVPGEFHVAAPELLLPDGSGSNARIYAPSTPD